MIVVILQSGCIEWTKKFKNIIIFNKGPPLPDEYNCINIPNIGLEYHTIFSYIYNNYENLDDYIIFITVYEYGYGKICSNMLDKIDYYLNDASSISADPNFATLTINFTTIYAYLESNSKITEILNASGGIICKVTFKNQSIKFLSPASSYSNKTIFLGNYSFGGQISALSSIKFYLYNKNFQIIEV